MNTAGFFIDKFGLKRHDLPPFVFVIRRFIVANTPQAKKRARQAEVRRQRNTSERSMVRTYIKKVIKAIEQGNQTEAEKAYNTAVPIIDRMASKGIIHKNKAARHKSRLLTSIRKLAA